MTIFVCHNNIKTKAYEPDLTNSGEPQRWSNIFETTSEQLSRLWAHCNAIKWTKITNVGQLVNLTAFPPKKIYNFQNWDLFREFRRRKNNWNYDVTTNKCSRPGKVENKRLIPKASLLVKIDNWGFFNRQEYLDPIHTIKGGWLVRTCIPC